MNLEKNHNPHPEDDLKHFQTLSFLMSSWLAIICTANWGSSLSICLTRSTLTSILLVQYLLLLELSFISSCSPLNLLWHFKHVLVTEFLLTGPKCAGLFLLGIHRLFFSAHFWTILKRSVNKSIWKQKGTVAES